MKQKQIIENDHYIVLLRSRFYSDVFIFLKIYNNLKKNSKKVYLKVALVTILLS